MGGYLPQKQQRLWSELEKLGGEFRKLQTALTQPYWRTETFAKGKLHVIWLYGEQGAWLLAVNGSEKERASARVPAVPTGTKMRALSARDALTGRKVTIREGSLRITLGPMETTAVQINCAKQ